MQRHTLTLLPGEYAAFRLPPSSSADEYAVRAVVEGTPVFIAITPEEITVTGPRSWAVSGTLLGPLRLLRLEGTFDADAVGVLVSLCAPLAQAGCFVLAQSAYSTDYLLVRFDQLARAKAALTGAGHAVADAGSAP